MHINQLGLIRWYITRLDLLILDREVPCCAQELVMAYSGSMILYEDYWPDKLHWMDHAGIFFRISKLFSISILFCWCRSLLYHCPFFNYFYWTVSLSSPSICTLQAMVEGLWLSCLKFTARSILAGPIRSVVWITKPQASSHVQSWKAQCLLLDS